MKTYTAKIERPVLEIRHDEDAESPRKWDNLGYFITAERGYNSPDNNDTLIRIVKSTGDNAGNQAEHIAMIKKAIKDEIDEKVVAIYPVVKYEHSGVIYRLGTMHGFDYSNCGFYIVTDKTACKTPKKSFETIIKQELETYTKWANGEVYGFVLHDADGKMNESCWGFYDLDEIKDALPDEWAKEDLSAYMTH